MLEENSNIYWVYTEEYLMTSEVLDLGSTQISYEFDQKNTDPTVTMIHCFGSNKKYWNFYTCSQKLL